MASTVALIPASLGFSQIPFYTARRECGASALSGMPVVSPALADTHCAYPRMDGQAKLI